MLIAEVSDSSWAQLESNAIQLTGGAGRGGDGERGRETEEDSVGFEGLSFPDAGSWDTY